MLRLVGSILVVVISNSIVWAQGKGVDKQNERVRDSGSSSAPASNGTKQDVGTGRGIDFGKGKSRAIQPLPNPYRLAARRDVILKAAQEVMQDSKLIVDDAASKPADGIIVSQPFTFIKGAVVTQGELRRYADLPISSARAWTRGRYTLAVEIQAIDGVASNVSVNAKIEGRTDGATGAEWQTLRSLGLAEDEFLAALIEKITGTPPPGRSQ